MFKSMEFFKCDRDCAMFVAMDKLSELDTKSHHVQTHPSHAQDPPLILGDLVTFYDEKDRPMNGVVRWIGKNREVLKDGTKIVGIETVSYMLCYVRM